MTKRLGKQIQLVGDDLFVTNTQHLSKVSGKTPQMLILIKLNQIGTLTETSDAIKMARSAATERLFLTVPEKLKIQL